MSDEDMVAFVERLKDSGNLLLQLVGGEPYMRADLLPKLAKVSPRTWVATAGSRPLVQLPRTTQFVFVDGADAQTHDLVRHKPGLFDLIVRNLKYAKDKGIGPIHLHMVINALNYTQVSKIVETFCLSGLAKSVVYSTHTPIPGALDDNLYLNEEQLLEAQDLLGAVKKAYPGHVSMSDAMIRCLNPTELKMQKAETCPTAKYVSSYRADGTRIPQCIFGSKANCSGCGCVVTSALKNVVSFPDLGTARILARLIPLGQ
jgi:MoaA/NifB/PqqE/SkfB family radical SAM enzyme